MVRDAGSDALFDPIAVDKFHRTGFDEADAALLEQQRKPKNLTLDYILHSAAMVVTFAALTAHVLAYLSYAGGAGGARASPAVSQAMFAAVLAPHLLTSLLVARKAFSFPWCVLLCFSWVALPLAGVVLTIYEFERATMFVGGRHAMDTFRRRSSFTAISGIPVHEYEALRNLCLLLTGDLPMMGLAAVAGFATFLVCVITSFEELSMRLELMIASSLVQSTAHAAESNRCHAPTSPLLSTPSQTQSLVRC